ncbi:uncharacterized protein [Chelonus insularis]|uniref:uncharacterized protein n=1 Tax=Chelonus insularis TaxID=460826 RepID=UPI00158F42DE|nr:uncharacterized protein LOC118065755 [Chelonus insularis]
MAFFSRNEGFKRVPWLSFPEWYQVYKQIYSNDNSKQLKAYDTLLVWKARMPKLPVGVDCTFSLIHVCLRDREWTPKINVGKLPLSYENDLCLLYSTTIMRFLNHISNIGHTKQTSLFQIAKQLNIPEWIVNLRHDAAHGHQLPSIDLFRIAANFLLTWLHNEYWVAEARALQKEFINDSQPVDAENESPNTLINLIELWIAVGLYNTAEYPSVSSLPDEQLQETLNELRISSKKSKRYLNANINENNDSGYRLATAKFYLLTEIYSILNKKKLSFDSTTTTLNVIMNSELFLPTGEFLQLFLTKSNLKNNWEKTHLPKAIIKFWQPFIAMLHERNMLDSLVFKLIEFINSDSVSNGTKQKKLIAALWIKSIAQGLIKLKFCQKEMQVLEQSYNNSKKKLTPKILESKIKEKMKSLYPQLQYGLWLDIKSDIPTIFSDINFVKKVIINPNEFTLEYVEPLLDLVVPSIETEVRNKMLDLIGIYLGKKSFFNISCDKKDKVYTREDLIEITGRKYLDLSDENEPMNEEEIVKEFDLADNEKRNSSWKLSEESENINWATSDIGILPWQIGKLDMLELNDDQSKVLYPITRKSMNTTAGFVDLENLISDSQVKWEEVLRKKQRRKRKKIDINAGVTITKAIEVVKKNKIN